VGKATKATTADVIAGGFQSTPSVGKATGYSRQFQLHPQISIHAFRGEGDLQCILYTKYKKDFNPRLPWGRRHGTSKGKDGKKEFQSTPSVGKATYALICHDKDRDISIHAFRGEGD